VGHRARVLLGSGPVFFFRREHFLGLDDLRFAASVTAPVATVLAAIGGFARIRFSFGGSAFSFFRRDRRFLLLLLLEFPQQLHFLFDFADAAGRLPVCFFLPPHRFDRFVLLTERLGFLLFVAADRGFDSFLNPLRGLIQGFLPLLFDFPLRRRFAFGFALVIDDPLAVYLFTLWKIDHPTIVPPFRNPSVIEAREGSGAAHRGAVKRGGGRGSNPRPLAPQARALPTELPPPRGLQDTGTAAAGAARAGAQTWPAIGCGR
jgi:hypothetical protein